MATILFSAVGAAVGGAMGGSVLGLSSAVIGRAVGATLGRALDARLLGAGADPVETGRVDRFRLTGAGEGVAVPRLWGAMRLGGHVIWASRFLEHRTTEGGGGKGAPRQPSVTQLSYTVSLAVALCEGPVRRVGRIWADGTEIAPESLTLRVYHGDADQMPDPKIEAVEGAGNAPCYRGIAYVVIEDLDLGRFGNRVPQFSFEVERGAQAEGHVPLADLVPGVALIPGTGEYALATTPVTRELGPGRYEAVNVNTPSGRADFTEALDALRGALPNCGSALLVVSWFGSDLRCGACRIEPKVEYAARDAAAMPWSVSGRGRAGCPEIGRLEDRPVYGGTPADAAVIEALRAMAAAGGPGVVYYPFILMEVMPGNGLGDPWSGAADQPVLPWRGRITLEAAPGRPGSPDGTAAAEAQVAAFFGTCRAADFGIGDGVVSYAGPEEWSYRRFILHQAALCAASGVTVDAFCIGSEMRGLTQIRGAGGSFPGVAGLCALADEVRALLGPGVKIGYAADWSEYFGYHPQDGSGDVLFPLDDLWAHPDIDFVGIDNYMPLTDWRDGTEHLDAGGGAVAVWDLAALKAGIEGGEGYDWYYADDAARTAQRRTPITDGAHGEDWVFRYKDLRGWWGSAHHPRLGGVRQAAPTAWVPEMKPIWFIEIGCAALDKATNQPNKFLDLLSSESALPVHSDGRRDDLIQARYLRAILEHWAEPGRNPVSSVYGGPMLDLGRTHVWAWDTRPWPAFPNNSALWADGVNHGRGHWLTGRTAAEELGAVILELCAAAGVPRNRVDVREVHGLVRGLTVATAGPARAVLQQLVVAHGLDVIEREGVLVFRTRRARPVIGIGPDDLVADARLDADVERSRAAEAEMAGRVRVSFTDAGGDYATRTAEAILPGDPGVGVADSEVPLALTVAEGRALAERWLAEARVARDGVRLAVPPSLAVGPGDLIRLEGDAALFRVDRVETTGARLLEGVRVEPSVWEPVESEEEAASLAAFVPPVPVLPLFLDLPVITGEEVPHAPHLAVAADPWPGAVQVWASGEDAGYAFERSIARGAVVGVTETALAAAAPGRWDRGPALRVRVTGGGLTARSTEQVLRGANLFAIGDGDPGGWELFQARDIVPVAPDLWELSGRLRGQLGSEPEMRAVRAAGSWVVALEAGLEQLTLAASARGYVRHYRIGPAGRGYDDPSYVHAAHAFEGRGLRPYAPAHLRGRRAGGDLAVSWVRRTRIDGDRWDAGEVPLGEAAELYRVEVSVGGAVRRVVEVGAPGWVYSAAMQAEDGIAGPFEVAVAQVSDRVGPGVPARRTFNG